MADFTHFNSDGTPQMVDVGDKKITPRHAKAEGTISLAPQTLAMIKDKAHKKGDVIQIAQLAGIMAAKKTAHLIPLCHPLSLSHVSIDITPIKDGLEITAECRINAKTGVEMEALTAVSITALTIYDMCKAVDKSMTISDIRLVHKTGGASDLIQKD